eukprot:5005326-Amphidinium_carterae.1
MAIVKLIWLTKALKLMARWIRDATWTSRADLANKVYHFWSIGGLPLRVRVSCQVTGRGSR